MMDSDTVGGKLNGLGLDQSKHLIAFYKTLKYR